jgi:excisionase family DNA binding protein
MEENRQAFRETLDREATERETFERETAALDVRQRRKLMYRVPEAVELTSIGRSRLYELMASGELESVKLGNARLIPHDALLTLVARLREEAAYARA